MSVVLVVLKILCYSVAGFMISFYSWRLGRRQAFRDAAWKAEMWMTVQYGNDHECNRYQPACYELGKLADRLREMENGK